ncbi:MAG TPA: YciI family protein [Microlunatus sp.]
MIAVELNYQNPDPERIALRPQHRERLQRLLDEGKLFGAGPWQDDSGALMIFTTDSMAEAEELIAADPYLHTPGVSVVGYRAWNAVFHVG